MSLWWFPAMEPAANHQQCLLRLDDKTEQSLCGAGAGCERQRKTGAEYDSKLLNKAIAINWSLTVLSTVFTQLADPNFSSITTRGNILTEALQVRLCWCCWLPQAACIMG